MQNIGENAARDLRHNARSTVRNRSYMAVQNDAIRRESSSAIVSSI